MTALDWRRLAPEPREHDCNCRYCDDRYGFEPVDWPSLIKATANGVEYVTDRYLMIRADLAPIPDDFEGSVIDQGTRAQELFCLDPLDEEPIGRPFRWTVIHALVMTGWRLRVLNYPENSQVAQLRHAVVDQDGHWIGVAIASKKALDDEYEESPYRTINYGDWSEFEDWE